MEKLFRDSSAGEKKTSCFWHNHIVSGRGRPTRSCVPLEFKRSRRGCWKRQRKSCEAPNRRKICGKISNPEKNNFHELRANRDTTADPFREENRIVLCLLTRRTPAGKRIHLMNQAELGSSKLSGATEGTSGVRRRDRPVESRS